MIFLQFRLKQFSAIIFLTKIILNKTKVSFEAIVWFEFNAIYFLCLNANALWRVMTLSCLFQVIEIIFNFVRLWEQHTLACHLVFSWRFYRKTLYNCTIVFQKYSNIKVFFQIINIIRDESWFSVVTYL